MQPFERKMFELVSQCGHLREVIELLLDKEEAQHHEILKLRATNHEKWDIFNQLDSILREHGHRLTDIKDYPDTFRKIIYGYTKQED